MSVVRLALPWALAACGCTCSAAGSPLDANVPSPPPAASESAVIEPRAATTEIGTPDIAAEITTPRLDTPQLATIEMGTVETLLATNEGEDDDEMTAIVIERGAATGPRVGRPSLVGSLHEGERRITVFRDVPPPAPTATLIGEDGTCDVSLTRAIEARQSFVYQAYGEDEPQVDPDSMILIVPIEPCDVVRPFEAVVGAPVTWRAIPQELPPAPAEVAQIMVGGADGEARGTTATRLELEPDLWFGHDGSMFVVLRRGRVAWSGDGACTAEIRIGPRAYLACYVSEGLTLFDLDRSMAVRTDAPSP